MRCVSTKNKSEEITFYLTIYLINVGPSITEYKWVEKNSSFYLTLYHNILPLLVYEQQRKTWNYPCSGAVYL